MSTTSFSKAFNNIGGQVAVPYTAGSGHLYTNIPSGSLQFITMTNGGSSYTSAPSVSFSGGGGSGAAATATIDSGSGTVIGVTITNAGSGYTSAPSVSFSGGGGGSGAAAVSGISLFALSGSEWARFTAVDLSGNVQSILKVTAVTSSVTSVVVTNGGSSYGSAPSVNFSGGGGSSAAATATISGGIVTSIEMTNYGSGYTSAPSVSFSGGGGGSGAAATAYITYKLTIDSAIEGTTDIDLSSGFAFEMRITAGLFNDFATAVNNLESGGLTIGSTPISSGSAGDALYVGSSVLAQSGARFTAGGALSVLRDANAFGGGAYTAFVIGDLVNGETDGAGYFCAASNPAHAPFPALSGWDYGSLPNEAHGRMLFLGGGGWDAPDANSIQFVTCSTYTQTHNTGLPRLLIDSNGVLHINPPSVSPNVVDTTTTLAIKPLATTQTGLSIVAQASQTAHLQEWKNSSSTVMTAVKADGTISLPVMANTSAVASSLFIDSSASNKLCWKDSNNGLHYST